VQRQYGQAADGAGPSCAPDPSSQDKWITVGQTRHGEHLARKRKPGGKQVRLMVHSTVPSIEIRMRAVFASWFTNGC